MQKTIIIIINIIVLTALFFTMCPVKVFATAKDDYYSKAAKIIGTYMYRPKKCIENLKSFVRKNVRLIESAKELILQEISEEDLKKAEKEAEMLHSKKTRRHVTTGIANYQRTLSQFKGRNPKYGDKAASIVENALGL